jgi:hypothetical protein
MNENEPRTGRGPLRPGRSKKILWALAVIGVAVLGADLFYEKAAHYSWEKAPGFYAFFGFSSCVLAVMVSKGLRRIGMRDEDYYD